jgi:hypothetical protein
LTASSIVSVAVAAPIADQSGVQQATASIAAVEKAQYPYPYPGANPYYYNGYNYCWYPNGWRGPGWYWCGYAWRSGYGWGGPWAWGWGRGWGRGWGGHGGWHGHR